MTRKAIILFCDNEHGTGDICFPDLTKLSGFEFQEVLIKGNTVGSVRRAAKAAGWGRVGGVDYCPACMGSMGDDQTEAQA